MQGEFYPLRFEPILRQKVWGGQRLGRWGKSLSSGDRVGESWELADLGSTSPDGGGGQAARSVVANGPLGGRTLHEVLEAWGDSLLGGVALTPSADFPLLVKLLDAGEHLSVQVHPSRAYAQRHAGVETKNECWYVLEARPGSLLFAGVRGDLEADGLRRAIQRGDVPDHLLALPAEPGSCLNLPSGTLHAIGAGVLLAEVQTPSDTTFRVYDWAQEYGRADRRLHIEEALECVDLTLAPRPSRLVRTERRGCLARTDAFELWEYRIESTTPVRDIDGAGCAVLMAIWGRLRLDWNDGAGPMWLEPGATCLVPAVLRDSLAVSSPTRARFLWVTLPPAG